MSALIKVSVLVPSTYRTAHNHLEVQFQGIQCPLLGSWDSLTIQGACTHIRIHSHTHKNKENTSYREKRPGPESVSKG